MEQTQDWLPMDKNQVRIILTSGASCPDAVVDRVMQKVLSFFENTVTIEEAVAKAISKNQ
jgi:4-hydroxy-3-methylbut-2-enyl diphosphate reductase